MTVAPQIVGTVSHVSVNGAQLPTIATPTPPLADGDLALVLIGSQVTTGGQAADYTNDRTFARVGVAFAAPAPTTRLHGLYAMPFPSAAGAPANVTFTRSGTSVRQLGAMFIARGVDPTDAFAAEATAFNTVSGATVTVAALTAPEDNCLAVATFSASWGSPNDHAVATPPAGWTHIGSYLEPPAGTTAVSRNTIHIYTREVDTGSTGTCALTWVGTPAQATGQMVLLRPVPDAPPVGDAQPWYWTGTEWVGPCTIEVVT